MCLLALLGAARAAPPPPPSCWTDYQACVESFGGGTVFRSDQFREALAKDPSLASLLGCENTCTDYPGDQHCAKNPDLIYCDDFSNPESVASRWAFIGGHISYRVGDAQVISGEKCFGGVGNCLQFDGCTAYGDIFSQEKISCPGRRCEVRFQYTGRLYAGVSQTIPDEAKGYGHRHWWRGWTPETGGGALGTEWRQFSFTPGYDNFHIMLETFHTSHTPQAAWFCNTIIDNVEVVPI